MITCVVDYQINPAKIAAFEEFAKAWIPLVNKHGGRHHGYFLPSEGASDRALALFSFESLAAYEQYRKLFGVDRDSCRPTGSGRKAAAWSGTSAASCARCCQKTSKPRSTATVGSSCFGSRDRSTRPHQWRAKSAAAADRPQRRKR